MERKTKFRHYIEAVLIYALPWALRPLPFKWRISIGGAVIGFAVRTVPILRRRIDRNLDLVFPELPDKKGLIKRISRHIGRGYMVVFYSKDYNKNLRDVTMAPEAFSEIRAAQDKGQPVILVSGHFGQWEAVRVMLARAGMPSASIYRESANPFFERHFVKAMSIGSTGLFRTGLKGTRNMMKHLRAGGIITVLLDQRVDEGKPLNFMGIPALSSPVMAELAVKTGALIIPTYAWLDDQGKVHINLDPPLEHEDPIAMTQKINDSLSAQVRAHPEQWYWLHNRWARPDLLDQE